MIGKLASRPRKAMPVEVSTKDQASSDRTVLNYGFMNFNEAITVLKMLPVQVVLEPLLTTKQLVLSEQ